MDASFIQGRITATKAIIIAYEEAIAALGASNNIESYTLDTGQTRQTVTRANLKDLNETLDSLYNRCTTLEARLNGSGVYTARPAW